MSSLSFDSPAKINLFLEVKQPREDGFHEIETVIQAVSIYDRITLFEIDNGIEIDTNAEWLPRGPENLAFRAARSFFQASGVSGGIRIRIDKCIPAGAGLGGGSSNAATVLMGLNSLFNKRLGHEELAGLAAEIGSDVPFFLYGHTALCRGRGECIEPLTVQAVFHYIVVVPHLQCPTAEIYGALREQGAYPAVPRQPVALIKCLERGDGAALRGVLFNRLEAVAMARDKELRAFRDALLDISDGGYMMTGSGSAFFKPVADAEKGNKERELLEKIKERYACDIFGCRGNIRGMTDGNYRGEAD